VEHEPVKIHKRKNFSRKDRLRLFIRDNGICGLTGEKIKAGEPYEIEHRVPLALGGTNDDDNLYIVIPAAHREKTKDDVRKIAKVKRIEARLNGTRRERKPIPSRGFEKPKDGYTWASRPFPNRKKDK